MTQDYKKGYLLKKTPSLNILQRHEERMAVMGQELFVLKLGAKKIGNCLYEQTDGTRYSTHAYGVKGDCLLCGEALTSP